jgi:hypothetical protein
MILEDLIHQFILLKKKTPLDVNELLDFTQSSYERGELSVEEYGELVQKLQLRGAKKPTFYTTDF